VVIDLEGVHVPHQRGEWSLEISIVGRFSAAIPTGEILKPIPGKEKRDAEIVLTAVRVSHVTEIQHIAVHRQTRQRGPVAKVDDLAQ
jgi:hypothetical protein